MFTKRYPYSTSSQYSARYRTLTGYLKNIDIQIPYPTYQSSPFPCYFLYNLYQFS